MKKTASLAPHLHLVGAEQSHERFVATSPFGNLHHTTTSPEEIAALSSGIKDKLQQRLLVSAHARVVKEYSLLVFGEPGVLDEKIREIIEHPSKGTRVIREILQNPQSLHRVAGVSVCGLKNRARRNAIKGVEPLCDALHNLMKTVEHAQNRPLFRMEQSGYQQPLENTSTTRDPLELCSRIEKKKDFFATDEVLAALKEDSFVQKCVESIGYLCEKVYGCSDTLAQAIYVTQRDPNMGPYLLEQLKTKPQSFGKLAGMNMYGIKNRARREAEEHVKYLCDNFQFFSDVVGTLGPFIASVYEEQRRQIDGTQHQTQETIAQDIRRTREGHHFTSRQEQSYKIENMRRKVFTL